MTFFNIPGVYSKINSGINISARQEMVKAIENYNSSIMDKFKNLEDNIENANLKITKNEKDIQKIDANLFVDNRTMILDASNTENWTKWYGNNIYVDNINKKFSDKGITAIDSGEGTAIRTNVRPFNLNGKDSVTIYVFIEGAKDLIELTFYFANGLNIGTFVSFSYPDNSLCEGWNEITIDLSKVSGGTGSLSNKIQSFQMRLAARSSTTVKITFDSMFINRKHKPSLIFMFDDGWLSQYTNAFPMLLERGFKGNLGVIPTLVGNTNYVTENNLKEMYRYGWDIFNHTYTHSDLTTLSTDNIVNEITQTKNWMIERGFIRAADFLAYPFGAHNKSVVEALKPHIKYSRTLIEGLESDFPLEPLRAKTRNIVNHPVATIQSYIDDAIRTGQTLVLTAHMIETTADTTMKYNKLDFAAILDYVYNNNNKINVKTLSEWAINK